MPYVPYRVGLTATPGDKLQDLFGQYLILDDGEALGTVYNNFEKAYFTSDRSGYKHERLPDRGKNISYKKPWPI